jgi:hypothetical protein
MRRSDRVPHWVMRVHAWFTGLMSSESRLVLGLFIVGLAVVALLVLSSMRFVDVVFDSLDTLSFLGLFLVNWLGNGGALVPIPGARFIGLMMIFQQAVLFPSWEVFAVSGAAMALGLLSYYIAGARTAESYQQGDAAGAEQLATDAGMLDGSKLSDDASSRTPTPDPAASPTATATTTPAPAMAAANTADPASNPSSMKRLEHRFSVSLRKAQVRAQPVIEKHGVTGMFLLCVGPTPLGTAAAFVGGLVRFGFARYLATSFAAKYLLAGIIVALALILSDTAHTVDLPF